MPKSRPQNRVQDAQPVSRGYGKILAATVLLATMISPATSPLAEPSIWIAPLSKTNPNPKLGAEDYMDLFEHNSRWGDVSSQVKVFKVYTYFISRSSDDELEVVLSWLRKNHISLALEARALSATRGCKMVRGDGGENTIHVLERIRRLKGDIAFLAMDEPLKHVLSGPPVCRANIDAAAKDVANNVRLFKSVFPNLKVGDIEPIANESRSLSLSEIVNWVNSYKAAAKEPLSFFHADVIWRTDWEPTVGVLAQNLHDLRVPFGIIYNGVDPADSDFQWASTTRAHYIAYEDRNGSPEHAIFQTWMQHPTHALPATDPMSLTGIVSGYLKWKSSAAQDKHKGDK